MKRLAAVAMIVAASAALAAAEPPRVTGIRAACRNGQTFVTWTDAAEGEAGAAFRYSLYRSDSPITQENLAKAELCFPGVMNNSAKMFGAAFTQKDRQNPETPQSAVWEDGKLVKKATPTMILEAGGTPLPMWSGVAVHTVAKDGAAYYAVVATDADWKALSKVEPGESATTEPVEEKVAPIQPIKQADSKVRGQWAGSTCITGTAGLPLHLNLHGSQATGGGASDHGDLFIYFGTPQMGWRDGLPGIFSVGEAHSTPQLILFTRDAIENPFGERPIETCWFGYFCVPIGAEHAEPRAYPFTENRLEWLVKWTIAHYKADPLRVYSGGQSMGGMGSTQFSFRHPELFAAVYPRLGRVKQTWLPAVGRDLPTSIHQTRWDKPAPMEDGKTSYFQRMDSIAWTAAHHEDLPFYAFAFGKQDTVAPWTDQIEMVKVLTAGHHGFALAWADGGHSSEGAKGMTVLQKYYPASKFALNASYPAFGNSSINDDMGRDRDQGARAGGVNLGFLWDNLVDEAATWSVSLSNDLAQAEMTVDVTPRRCQAFKPQPGEKVRWTNSIGGDGEVAADAWGLVTIEKVRIRPGEPAILRLTRQVQPDKE